MLESAVEMGWWYIYWSHVVKGARASEGVEPDSTAGCHRNLNYELPQV